MKSVNKNFYLDILFVCYVENWVGYRLDIIDWRLDAAHVNHGSVVKAAEEFIEAGLETLEIILAPCNTELSLQLETKVIRMFPKISQSRRMPLLC